MAVASKAPGRLVPAPTPLTLQLLLGGGVVLVFLMTLLTLNVASTCSAPLSEGDLSSAPVSKLGVAARLSGALKRSTAKARAALGALGGRLGKGVGASGPSVVGVAHSVQGSKLVPLLARTKRLAELLEDQDGDGARALGPAYAMAQSLVASINQAAHKDSVAAVALEAASKGSIPLDAPQFDPQALYTNQTCYIGTDESELCVYSGVLCFDGEGPVVVTSDPILERVDDLIHSCMDTRYQEPTSVAATGCVRGVFPGGGVAPYLNENMGVKGEVIALDGTYPLDTRRWGPANRGSSQLFREMHAAQVWGDKGEVLLPLVGGKVGAKKAAAQARALAGLNSLGGNRKPVVITLPKGAPEHMAPLAGLDVATKLLEAGPIPHPTIPGLTLAARTRVGDVDIDWVDPGLWLVGLDANEDTSPLRFFRRIMGLYEAFRSNATPAFGDHPRDGYVHFLDSWMVASAPSIYTDTVTSNRASYKIGNQWDMPPMTTLAFNAAKGKGKVSMGEYFTSLLSVAAPGVRPYFSELQSTLSPKHLMCSVKGGIPGGKHRLFSSRTDASMFKTYSYQKLGLGIRGVRPHPRYAPRKILLMKSSHTHDQAGKDASYEAANGRIWNWQEVETVVADTGVPYEVIDTVEGMSFADTVTLFSGVGILVAPHGDAMVNSVFMPAHAVVLELFPFMVKRNTFRQLANLLDIHYLAYHSKQRMPLDKVDRSKPEGLVYSRKFWDECEGKNYSSYDSVVSPVCMEALEAHPLVVVPKDLARVLKDAVDCSAAFSLKNPDWAALAPTLGLPVRDPPAAGEDKYGAYGRVFFLALCFFVNAPLQFSPIPSCLVFTFLTLA
jgi:hypothetical protein